MDPSLLAHEVMNALTPLVPYLGSAGSAIAGKVGEDFYERGKRLYDAIRARFAKEPDGKDSKALQAFVNDPDLGSTIETKLVRLIQNDPSFAATLLQILQSGPQMRIDASDEAQVLRNVMKNTQDHGDQSITASGKAIVEGNQMTISHE